MRGGERKALEGAVFLLVIGIWWFKSSIGDKKRCE